MALHSTETYNYSYASDLFFLSCPELTFCPVLCVCIAIIVHQESVCATFGSGLSSACVVDVGDQKTSLCCVEDGVSHRNSRSAQAEIMDPFYVYMKC